MKITLTPAQAEALAQHLRNDRDPDAWSLDLRDFQDALEQALGRKKANPFLTLDEVGAAILALDDWIRRVHADALAKGPAAVQGLQESPSVWNTVRLSVLLKLAAIQQRMEAQAQAALVAAGDR